MMKITGACDGFTLLVKFSLRIYSDVGVSVRLDTDKCCFCPAHACIDEETDGMSVALTRILVKQQAAHAVRILWRGLTGGSPRFCKRSCRKLKRCFSTIMVICSNFSCPH